MYIYVHSEDVRLLVKSKPLQQRSQAVGKWGGGGLGLELDTSEGNVFTVAPSAASECTVRFS